MALPTTQDNSIPQDTILGLLTSIEAGLVKLKCDTEPQDKYAGDLTYQCLGGGFDGWSLVVFNDCNSWDYLSEVISPDKVTVKFTQLQDMPAVLSYQPSADMAWFRYGIPGYLRWRDEVWEGFTGIRTEEMKERLTREARQKQIIHTLLVRLVEATRNTAPDEDPCYSESVREALTDWHKMGSPMFASSLDFLE